MSSRPRRGRRWAHDDPPRHPRRPRGHHAHRALVVPDRRLVGGRDGRRARLPHGHYLVDDVAGAIVGYAGLRAVQGASDADIQTIALDADHRGTGRGRRLLTALLDEATRRGARDVFLEVRADNPAAEQLYLSEAFVEIGRRPRYYQPDDVDAIVMKLDLRGRAAAPVAEAGRAHEPRNPAGARHRDELRRDRDRHRPRADAAEQHDRQQHG
ncbi:GNAT family N-acetyltransferase [Microbacterium sp. NIBRBAC000506063]|uniref:GNAT family N-acetyltransferase n=1 Tax=Microbacterium sp. NIBRBAC000506063 TaxID=2734618 RepID=UPI001CB73EA4|nr:GNAT family N-acetyltransferase [Microbacterium sp. NIBRBAC000506063]